MPTKLCRNYGNLADNTITNAQLTEKEAANFIWQIFLREKVIRVTRQKLTNSTAHCREKENPRNWETWKSALVSSGF